MADIKWKLWLLPNDNKQPNVQTIYGMYCILLSDYIALPVKFASTIVARIC